MKRAEVVGKGSVVTEPFVLDAFLKRPADSSKQKKVSKKALKNIADEMGLGYDESHITFAKKIINAYRKS
ncbi:MAG: hypothetical protein ABXS92_07625 [Sulfurimonas sp.]